MYHACGCLLFYPASEYRNFMVFMMGHFWHLYHNCKVAANPYVALLGSERRASRLNLSQAFNSLGTTIAPIIGALFF